MPRTTPSPVPPPPRPMYWLAIAWVAGLAGGLFLPLPFWYTLAGAAAATLAGAVGMLRSRRINEVASPSGYLLLGALTLLAWQAGSNLADDDAQAIAQARALPRELHATITGCIDEEPEYQEGGWRLVVRDVLITPALSTSSTLPIHLRQRMTLTLREDAANALGAALPLPGQAIRAVGDVYPLVRATSPSVFDSVRYWRSERLQARMSLRRVEDLELGPAPQDLGTSFLVLMRQARDGIGAIFEEQLPAPQANLARAFFLGEAERLELADRDAFRVTGLSHLMAVSGFNVALVLLVIMWLARICGAPPRLAAGIGIAAIVLFTALTGFEAPVARAAFIGVFVLLGVVLGRSGSALAGLALAVFASLVLQPRNITRIDWQLSYGCVLALLIFTPPLLALFPGSSSNDDPAKHPRSFGQRLLHTYLWLPIAATFAVQLGLFPLQLYYFRQINLLFPLANLVGITLGSLAMILLTVMILAAWIPFIAVPATWGTSITLEVLIEFIRGLQGVRATQLYLAPIPIAGMGLFFLIVLGGCWLRAAQTSDPLYPNRQRRSMLWRLGTLGALLAWLPLLGAARESEAFDLYVLDVGQGDAIVLRAPNGHVLEVDAGRNQPDEGRLVIAPFLQALAIDRIDTLVATHADADHIGGIPWLLNHFEIGRVMVGQDISDSMIYRQGVAGEIAREIPRYQVEWGAQLDGFGPLRIQCLGPVPGLDNNDASVVLLLTEGETQILLTGDLGKTGEDAILREHLARPVDVLKVGHHGSKSSTGDAWLDALQPKLALISVGARNVYHHPSPETLARLGAHHVASFRTDLLGTLWVHGDGRHVELYGFAGQ